MAAIDIGSTAIDRNSTVENYTLISKLNPANASGTITSIEIWANTNLENCEVATFFVVSGNFLSTRDTHAIGAVTSGSKQTFSGLSLTVVAGDYIGMYYTAGDIECTYSGSGTDIWFFNGDKIPCTNQEFGTVGSGGAFSLYGTGATEENNSVFFGMNF